MSVKMNLDNFKNICVVGFGKSGICLTELLLSLGKKVKITETKESSSFSSFIIPKFTSFGVDFEFGGHTKNFIKDADLLVLSPGVDLKNSAVYEFAKEFKIPTIGEVELASWLTSAKLIAITGTNGKSTTAFLTYRVLKSKNTNTYLAGNIGIPFSSCVLKTKKKDIIVLEISSFQLESIIEFRPFIACLLNLEPDHLDRYNTFNEYIEAKKNIFMNQKKNDYAILNKDLSQINSIVKDLKSKVLFFSSELVNPNYSAVYRIVNIFGLSKLDCKKIISNFKGLPHRMQFIKKIRGVTFLNDSKATSPASTAWALKNINTSIILIAGGKDKGLDYNYIVPYLKRVKKINLFGESALKIKDSLSNAVRKEIFSTLKEAVVNSFSEAKEKDTILFSPMCSSFDMYSNYRERGIKFIEIVKGIDEKTK